MNQLRLLYSSNFFKCASGYGVQSASLLPRLAALPEFGGRQNIAQFAWYGLQGTMHNFEGFTVYPAGVDHYGNDIIEAHTKDFGANWVVTLIDVWVLQQTAKKVKPALWTPWLPIDHDPVPQRVLDCLEGAYLPLTYSKWGHEMLRNAGVPNRYIAHGIETSIFRILHPGEVARFRQQVLGNPEHLTVMVAANKGYPDRKAFQVQLRAWANFARDKPGARLYMHTEPTPMYGGLDLPALARNLGIENKVIFPPRYEYFKGYPAEYMALIYNAADILLGASMSEGFGIPLIEAQACGCPVITTNFSAMPELVRWGVATAPLDIFWTPMLAWQAWPSHINITEALQAIYAEWESNGKCNDPAKRQFAQDAIHSEYSWDTLVREQWHPLVKRIAEEAVPVHPRFLIAKPEPVAPPMQFQAEVDNAPPLVAPETNGLHPYGVTKDDRRRQKRVAPVEKSEPATYAQEVEKMS